MEEVPARDSDSFASEYGATDRIPGQIARDTFANSFSVSGLSSGLRLESIALTLYADVAYGDCISAASSSGPDRAIRRLAPNGPPIETSSRARKLTVPRTLRRWCGRVLMEDGQPVWMTRVPRR